MNQIQMPPQRSATAPVRRIARSTRSTLAAVLLGALVFTSDLVLSHTANAGLDAQALLKLGTVGLCLAWVVTNLGAFPWRSAATWAWFAVLVWFACSELWSPEPVQGLGYVATLFGGLLFVGSAIRQIGTRATVRAVVIAAALFCVGSLLMYVANPRFAISLEWVDGRHVSSGRLQGLADAPNPLGRLAALGVALVLIWWKDLGLRFRMLTLAPMGLALVMSGSKTAILAVAATMAAAWLLRWRWRWTLPPLVVAIVLGGLLLIGHYDQLAALIARGDGDVTTGRVFIWQYAEALISQKPWFGWGYGAWPHVIAEYQNTLLRAGGFVPPHAHNAILQVLFSGGVVGLALFLIAIGVTMVQAFRYRAWAGLMLLGLWGLATLTETGGFAASEAAATLTLWLAVGLVGRKTSDRMIRP